MNLMYIKYNSKNCESIIKNGKNIVRTVYPVNDVTNNVSLKEKETVINIEDMKKKYDNKKNEEITNYFFSAVHKNYLNNRSV